MRREGMHMAASNIAVNFSCTPQAISDVAPLIEASYSHLASRRPEYYHYRVTNGLRQVLGMAAAYTSVDPLLRLAYRIAKSSEGIPQLQADEIEKRRTTHAEYRAKPERYLRGDEAVFHSVLFDLTSPVVRSAFDTIPSAGREAFSETYVTLTEDLEVRAEAVMHVEHPDAAHDIEFMADPFGPAGGKYPYTVRYIAHATQKSKDPAAQFFGGYEASAELAVPIIGDAWSAFSVKGCPIATRHQVLPDKLPLLSSFADMSGDRFNRLFFADRYCSDRAQSLIADLDSLNGTWNLTATESASSSSGGLARHHQPPCLGYDRMAGFALSPVGVVQALGLITIRSIPSEVAFLGS